MGTHTEDKLNDQKNAAGVNLYAVIILRDIDWLNIHNIAERKT